MNDETGTKPDWWWRRHTVWAPGALDHEPKKFRTLWRVWLPLYDVIAITAGFFAYSHGSNLLNGIFGPLVVDIVGLGFMAVAVLCLVAVVHPKLWKLEIGAKSLLIGMVATYIWVILFLPSNQQLATSGAPSYFVACMLAFGLPLALFRLTQLGEEQYDRRVEQRVEELRHDTGEVDVP